MEIRLSLSNRTQAPFAMIAPFKTEHNSCAPDLLDTYSKVTPKAQCLFLEIKRTHNYINNVCSYELTDKQKVQGSSEYKMLSRYISQLKKVGLIVKVKRDHLKQLGLPYKKDVIYFLVNPYLIRCKEYALVNSLWSAYPQKAA